MITQNIKAASTATASYFYQNRRRIAYSALCTAMVLSTSQGAYAQDFDIDGFLKSFIKPVAKGLVDYSTPIISGAGITGGIGAMGLGGGADGRAVFGKVILGVAAGAIGASGLLEFSGLKALAA